MFTGIVIDRARVRALVPATRASDTRIEIETSLDTSRFAIGASIACSGCCLTAIQKGAGWFAVEASAETLSKTTLGGWQVGTAVNIEPSLRVGDELGGHIVSGHVDCTAILVSATPEQGSHRLVFEAPAAFARYLAPKGSVAIDGISLTVNEVEDRPDGTARFGINVIPHTWTATTLGQTAPGGRVNMEVDALARYVARILGRN
ncbi:MAG: riboflavin synthase [Alphaproteobacteria bacterium]|nr:riboflavin synthase [Alphaproteobacteria bacterium]